MEIADNMLFSALIIVEIIVAVKAWSCVTPIKNVYNRVNTTAVLQFSADVTSLPNQFEVRFYNGSIKARVTYNTDRSSVGEAIPGVSITGDTAGNVVVTLDNVKQDNAGVYILRSAGFRIQCSCLYILRIPEKPLVTVNKTPSDGQNVTLTCSSTSSTTPSNHSLSLNYSWRVNNTDDPDGTKYTYSSNRKRLTVNNIVKDDANKQFTCTATEVVSNGYTSESSDPFSFAVYYGPDSARVNVTSPYHLKEGETLAVECIADCYPGCSYTWTNETSGSVVNSNNSLLYLGTVDKHMSGNYKCTSRNTDASYVKSDDIIVNIDVKERTLVKWFYIGNITSQSLVTVDEQDFDVTFTCKVSGSPAEVIKVTFNGRILKEQAHTNSLIYTIERATCFDSGVYRCEGKSKDMEISHRIVSLFVKCSPRPLRKIQENITSSLDTPITLSFEVLAYPEPGQRGFTWYKERGTEWLQILSNEDFLVLSSELVTNLTIESVSESDFGQYRATVENSVGSYHQYFQLLPQDSMKPDLNKDDSYCGNTLTIGIVLGIIAVIAITYAGTVTILWKRNISITKSRSGNTFTDIDRGKELSMQRSYVNVASTSNEGPIREQPPQNIGGEVADVDDPDKTQYTELDILSREKNDDMYDVIKRNETNYVNF